MSVVLRLLVVVPGDLSALTSHHEVYRSVAVDSHSYGAPAAFHGLANLHLSSSHQHDEHEDEHTSALDAFDALPQGKRNELSLNPKYEQQIDYTVETDTTSNFMTSPAPTSPPCPPGGYLEPSSHFFVSATDNPQSVLQSLYDLLRERQVDCEMCPDGWKMRGEAYRECARVEFLVRLFSTPSNARGEYAVEFQRRFGDGMVFHNLYAEVKKAWEGQQSAHSSPVHNRAVMSPLTCPPLDDQPDMQCCRQEQQTVLKCLLQMCKSECVDVKANAITALAEMSSKPEYKAAMLECGVVEQFIQCLGCTYSDVHRCALTGLANLVSCRRNRITCTAWMQSEKIKHAMCKLITSGCPQVVRECARSFAFIAETLKDQVKDDACFRHCVEKLMKSQDAQARMHAQKAAETLQG